MNEFDRTYGSNYVEDRNSDSYGNMNGESNSAITWKSDATSAGESNRTAYSNIALFMKKITTKNNRKGWKLRATHALNLLFCSPAHVMYKYFIWNHFYIDRVSSVEIKYSSRHFNFLSRHSIPDEYFC